MCMTFPEGLDVCSVKAHRSTQCQLRQPNLHCSNPNAHVSFYSVWILLFNWRITFLFLYSICSLPSVLPQHPSSTLLISERCGCKCTRMGRCREWGSPGDWQQSGTVSCFHFCFERKFWEDVHEIGMFLLVSDLSLPFSYRHLWGEPSLAVPLCERWSLLAKAVAVWALHTTWWHWVWVYSATKGVHFRWINGTCRNKNRIRKASHALTTVIGSRGNEEVSQTVKGTWLRDLPLAVCFLPCSWCQEDWI